MHHFQTSTSPEYIYQISLSLFFPQVNTNGLLSFSISYPNYSSDSFPLLGPELIAPLRSDVDTTGSGTVSYRETDSEELLQRVKLEIRRSFEVPRFFVPASLFIVTWDRVGHYENGTNMVCI